MQKMTKEEQEKQIIIYGYEFNSSQRTAREEANIKAAIEALKPVIRQNLKYLRYAQAKGFFTMNSKEEETETATTNAITTVASRAIHFEPYDAEKLAFSILQDVNLHEEARQVADLLKLDLKGYEIE